MECGEHDGRCASMARGASGVGLQLQLGLGGVAVGVGARLPGGAARTAGPASRRAPAPAAPRRVPAPAAPHALDAPFMSDMDEISYWISTKRAPCLMNYDKLVRKQSDEAQCSTTVPEAAHPPRKKKKKRKLSILDEDSVSTEKPQNIFFEVPSKHILPEPDNKKTESVGSDVDFNITATTVAEKNKKTKLNKNSRGKLHKKGKLVTSTPKAPVTLRRSLRRAQQTGDSTNLDSSFEIFNASMVSNGHCKTSKSNDKVNRSTQMFAAGDCDSTPNNKRDIATRNQKSKTAIHSNGQFEDLSDVSGFTANYIRSTKVQSGKTPKKLRCKSSRTLGRESRPNSSQEPTTTGNMVMCLNKATNTGIPPTNLLNCSTDSSQNIINLVTTRSHDRSKMDKSTSLLKFVDVKGEYREDTDETTHNKRKKINISFQSQSSAASRYPKRYKNHTDAVIVNEATGRTRASRRNCLEYNNSDKKENPEESAAQRARGAAPSVLVVSNCTEGASSPASVNVARRRARAAPRRSARPRRAPPDSTRERSGFAACFSDSDDDSAPLVHRKYFCN